LPPSRLSVTRFMLKRLQITQPGCNRTSKLAPFGLLFALLSVLAIQFDTWLVSIIDATNVRGDARRAIELGEAFSFGPAAMVIALGVVLSDSRSKWFTSRLFLYPLFAGIVANISKLAIPRLRPRSLADLELVQGSVATGWDTFTSWRPHPGLIQVADGSASTWQSFPSGHTATAIGLAIGLSRLYPQARWYFFALAAFAGLQRIVVNAHYPSDVLAGAALAMSVCWLFERKSPWSLAIPEAARNAESTAIADCSRAA
jgi:membrane-associated phospholipid phosphatase